MSDEARHHAHAHQIVLLPFQQQDACLRAFEEAKHLPGLRQAAVVSRDADGELTMPETHSRGVGVPTIGAGLVGGAIGLLGGPLGALIGFAAGASLGGASELSRDQQGGAALIVLSSRIGNGASLLILDVEEHSPEHVDTLASGFGIVPERIPADEFRKLLSAAEREADAEVAEERKDQQQSGA